MLLQICFPDHVTGADVVAVLERVAGQSLRMVGLRQCSKLSSIDIQHILDRLHATCPAVAEVDITGCSDHAVLRALSVRARSTFDTASPLNVRTQLMALAEAGAARCALSLFRNALNKRAPRLVFDQEFAPEEDTIYEVATEACVAGDATAVAELELALLLFVSFPIWNRDEIRVVDNLLLMVCWADPMGQTASLSLSSPADIRPWVGNLGLALMLIDVGANPSVSNFEGDTPLLMACQAGNLTLAKRLRDAGANVSVANRRGDTPLLD